MSAAAGRRESTGDGRQRRPRRGRPLRSERAAGAGRSPGSPVLTAPPSRRMATVAAPGDEGSERSAPAYRCGGSRGLGRANGAPYRIPVSPAARGSRHLRAGV